MTEHATPPADLAELDTFARGRALHTDVSILLGAPAGSGKTTVLTQRLLALLAVVDEPEQVLAITFTRKAAAEMRKRVLAALAGDIEPAHPQAALLAQLAAKVHARSTERGWQLEAQASRLRILTIDAFNFSLAAQRPLAAGGGTSLSIADRPVELYARAARRALLDGEGEPGLRRDLDLLFERTDNDWGRVEGLLASMLARRAHWLPHVLVSSSELRARIDAALRHIVTEQLERNLAALPREWLAAAQRLPGVGRLDAATTSLEAWCALAAATLTKEGTLRKRVDARIGPAYREAANKTALKDVIAGLEGIDAAADLLAATRRLPPAVLPADDGEAIDALARVLTWAARYLQVEFAQAGQVDHVYVAGAARAALHQDGAPSDLAIHAGMALRHILVDEFQDTSIEQFALLEALVQDWSSGDGRTLFVVGDPMQSIYQFREAEVGLFLRAREKGIGPVRLESLHLTRNFRSRPALVEFSNGLFASIFPQHDDVRAAAVRHTPSVAARAAPEDGGGAAGALPAVSLRALVNGDGDDEARAVVERVRALRAADAHGRITILVPARPHAVPISARLAEAGFTVLGVDLVPLAEVPVVRDAVALLRALLHRGDRASWLSVLRAPWCGLTLRSLGVLSPPRDPLTIREALQAQDRIASLEPREAARVARVRPILESALASVGRGPPGEALASVWMRLGGADCHDEAELAAARELFTALDAAWHRGEWRGAASIDGLLADLYARPDGTDRTAIEIMTIHRAKGLEFEHVVLAGLGRPPRHDDAPLLRWLDLPRGEGGPDLLMAPIVPAAERDEHRLGRYLRQLDAERRRHEQLRVLYVAATRARESLHWIGGVSAREGGEPEPQTGTLLAAAWPALAGRIELVEPAAVRETGNGAAGSEKTPAGAVAPPATRLERLPDDWQAPAPDGDRVAHGLLLAREATEAPEFSWVQETARHVGTVVHRMLEHWDEARPATPAGIDAQQPLIGALLARLGVPVAQRAAATATVLEALQRTWEDPRGRWLFDPDHRDAATELALSGLVDGRLVSAVIDRSFVDADGTRWVIDYKTGRHEGGDVEAFLAQELERYRPQLSRYATLARALGREPVRAALYFPLLGAFRAYDQ